MIAGWLMPCVGHWPTRLCRTVSCWCNTRSLGSVGLRAGSKSAKGTPTVPIVQARLKKKKRSNSLLIWGKKTFLNSAQGSGSFTFDFPGDCLKDFKESKARWTLPVRLSDPASVQCRKIGSSKHTMYSQSTSASDVRSSKSQVMHNSAGRFAFSVRVL